MAADEQGTLIDITRTALAAQSARIDAIDLKAYGLLGFDAALLAAIVAAGKPDLGRHWWLAIIGLGVSALFAIGAAGGEKRGVEMGPRPKAFYEKYSNVSSYRFNTALFADLEWALDKNQEYEESKRGQLASAAGVLILTAIYSAFIFTLWR